MINTQSPDITIKYTKGTPPTHFTWGLTNTDHTGEAVCWSGRSLSKRCPGSIDLKLMPHLARTSTQMWMLSLIMPDEGQYATPHYSYFYKFFWAVLAFKGPSSFCGGTVTVFWKWALCQRYFMWGLLLWVSIFAQWVGGGCWRPLALILWSTWPLTYIYVCVCIFFFPSFNIFQSILFFQFFKIFILYFSCVGIRPRHAHTD